MSAIGVVSIVAFAMSLIGLALLMWCLGRDFKAVCDANQKFIDECREIRLANFSAARRKAFEERILRK